MTWRKSSHSMANGNCAEVGNYSEAGNYPEATEWRKPVTSFANGNCVEAGNATTEAAVVVRDTQEESHPYRVHLRVPAAAWNRFIADIKDGIHP